VVDDEVVEELLKEVGRALVEADVNIKVRRRSGWVGGSGSGRWVWVIDASINPSLDGRAGLLGCASPAPCEGGRLVIAA
jgi:hypothetical protein